SSPKIYLVGNEIGKNHETAFIYTEEFTKYDLGRSHPLNQERIRLHYELCKDLGMLNSSSVLFVKPKYATDKEIRLVHSEDYVNKVVAMSKNGIGLLDLGDTPAFPGMYEITNLIVGATLKATEYVMSESIPHAWNPAGGLHHAQRDHAAGFCIFNDVAIAIEVLKTHYKVQRILYFDHDVHHGDGVQWIFYTDPRVLTVSFHESGRFIFPGTGFTDEIGEGTGKGFSVNMPFPPNTPDEAYLHAFKEIIPILFDLFEPEVVVQQCGVDSHFSDPLGHLALTTHAYKEMASMMHELVHKYTDGKWIVVGGGGYNLASVPRCWTTIFSQITGNTPQNELPASWRDIFKRIAGREAPTTLYDSSEPQISMNTREMVFSTIQKTVTQVKANLEQYPPTLI
ncbi:MAG: acetoin utilization protein AcuC, partial [Candidatus Hodarchaeota archaeon]